MSERWAALWKKAATDYRLAARANAESIFEWVVMRDAERVTRFQAEQQRDELAGQVAALTAQVAWAEQANTLAVDVLAAYQAYVDLLVRGWRPLMGEKEEALALWSEVERLSAALAAAVSPAAGRAGDEVIMTIRTDDLPEVEPSMCRAHDATQSETGATSDHDE